LFAAIVTDQLEMVKCLVNYYQPLLKKDEEQTADEDSSYRLAVIKVKLLMYSTSSDLLA
jgi:hypothetical protein